MTNVKVLIALLLAYSVVSFAADDKLAVKKQRIVDRLDQRINILTNFKSCIQNTEDNDGIKNCRETKKNEMKKLKESKKNS